MTEQRTEQLNETTTIWVWSQSDQNIYGDEYLEFYGARCDDDGEPTGDVLGFSTYGYAIAWAERTAEREGLELIDDADRW